MKTAAVATILVLSASAAFAQPVDYMTEECANDAQSFYMDYEAQASVSYEGQRTDGTHAVNGTINLENRSEDFQCSYNADGTTLIDFVVEGKSWPDFVSGDGSPAQKAAADSAPAASDEAAQVQFDAGASSVTLEGAIAGNEIFDYALNAAAGQMMRVELTPTSTNGDGTIYFNILPPGSSGEATYVGSMDGNETEFRLSEGGPWVIRLYLMGNDRDTDKTVGYELFVAIN
ncbi:hypothetical protein [Salipiger sp.]|uniref:hypothetical protein n=1 Tax=Salipiger sp. TaxID=2078585 RepID=UPI003A96ED85